MLWVEQPVGTGFATGNATATTEEEIAQDFVYVHFAIYIASCCHGGVWLPLTRDKLTDS